MRGMGGMGLVKIVEQAKKICGRDIQIDTKKQKKRRDRAITIPSIVNLSDIFLGVILKIDF